MSNTALQGSQQTVLVVDDDEFSREVLRKKLNFWGVTDIHMAHDGCDGLAVLDVMARAPDFLICDIFMPDMDGVEFVVELAKRQYKGGIVLVSGVSRDMLEVAQTMATMKGLRVLGTFIKPLHYEPLGQVLGFSTASEQKHDPK
ncbi:MAG: response regulator [Rhodoferax sp.]|nr:response regulator [Rhodoferax sp.]